MKFEIDEFFGWKINSFFNEIANDVISMNLDNTGGWKQ
jgi:hypothetical protein